MSCDCMSCDCTYTIHTTSTRPAPDLHILCTICHVTVHTLYTLLVPAHDLHILCTICHVTVHTLYTLLVPAHDLRILCTVCHVTVHTLYTLLVPAHDLHILCTVCHVTVCHVTVHTLYTPGFHTEGGVPWDIPPQGPVFPPPRISYHNVIMNQIENCTSINASGVVATTSCNYPKCIRINLRECKDQKFSGGACPQTPLVCRASTKHGFPPPSLKSCMKPCTLLVPAHDLHILCTVCHVTVHTLYTLLVPAHDLHILCTVCHVTVCHVTVHTLYTLLLAHDLHILCTVCHVTVCDVTVHTLYTLLVPAHDLHIL